MSRKYEQKVRNNLRRDGVTPYQEDLTWDYLENHCDTDEEASAFWIEHWMDDADMTISDVNKMFGIKDENTGPTQSQLANRHAKKIATSNDIRTERMAYLKEALREKSLWGDPIDETSNTLKYFDPKTEKHFSIKLGRHKYQLVTTKEMPDKLFRIHDRAIELHEVVEANPELFEAISLANNKISFVEIENPTYSFGSIVLTHHKD